MPARCRRSWRSRSGGSRSGRREAAHHDARGRQHAERRRRRVAAVSGEKPASTKKATSCTTIENIPVAVQKNTCASPQNTGVRSAARGCPALARLLPASLAAQLGITGHEAAPGQRQHHHAARARAAGRPGCGRRCASRSSRPGTAPAGRRRSCRRRPRRTRCRSRWTGASRYQRASSAEPGTMPFRLTPTPTRSADQKVELPQADESAGEEERGAEAQHAGAVDPARAQAVEQHADERRGEAVHQQVERDTRR